MTCDMQLNPVLQRVAQVTTAGVLRRRVGPQTRKARNAAEDAAILDALVCRLAHGCFDVCGEYGGLLVT